MGYLTRWQRSKVYAFTLDEWIMVIRTTMSQSRFPQGDIYVFGYLWAHMRGFSMIPAR